MPGLRFKILYGDDQVWLDNRSGKTVIIKGYSGEPYLRFSPAGIYVNINSPAGYLNQDRYARVQVPKSASASATPKVKAAPRKPHHIFDWKVPATENGKRFVIAGSLDYKPPPLNTPPYGLIISLATLVGVGLIGLFALRRVLIRSLK
jgi:hypothetical protein